MSRMEVERRRELKCYSAPVTPGMKGVPSQEYREKKRSLDYYVTDLPEGKATIVNVPFNDGDEFADKEGFVRYHAIF